MLTFFDVEPTTTRFLGTMRWQADPRVLAEAALQGGWFAASDPNDLAAFQSRFRNIFGRAPIRSRPLLTTPPRLRWWSRATSAIAASRAAT